MPEKVFQFKIKSITVEENGRIKEKEKGANVIEAKLYYPKEGLPAVTTLCSVSLEDKKPRDFSNEPYEKQILFKQSFQGDSVLKINVSAEVKLSSLDKALLKMLGAAAKATVGTITGIGLIATAAVTSITESIFTFSDKKSKIIGTGSLPIDENLKEGVQEIPIVVPKEVEIVKLEKDRVTRRTLIKKMPLPKGMPNGKILIEIKRIV